MFQTESGRGLMLGLILAGALVASISAAADGDAEWTGDIALSVSAQSGTTDSFSGAVDAKTDRASEKDHVTVRLKADYGTSEKTGDDGANTTQDSQTLTADWKYIVRERFFWGSRSEVSRDGTQDRKLRVAADTGPGYRVWQSDVDGNEHFDVRGGVGYRLEIVDVPTGTPESGTDDHHFVDLVAGFEYKNMFFDDNLDFTHTGSVRAPANGFSDFIVNSEALVGVPFSESWSFRAGVSVEYINGAPDGINKVTTKTSVGLGYKF
jgi:putative salt-induced outer membrane protein YdiY